MNIRKIYFPKGFAVIVIIFAAIFALAMARGMGAIAGLSMACLFGSLASLIAYIVSALKKKKSGVYLLSFIILLIGMAVSNVYTAQYAASQQLNTGVETTK